MRSDRETALRYILAHEGGKVDHPKDPGGRTNMGVTQRVYDSWRRSRGLAPRDVWTIELSEALAIYNAQYLDPIRYDDLPAGLGYAVADYAVNSGVSRAARDLQREIGVKADGIIGQITLARLDEIAERGPADVADLIIRYCERRMAFLRRLKTWGTFGRGWTRRVMGHRDGAQADDNGVIDYAVQMTQRDLRSLPAPRPIGHYAGETPGHGTQEDLRAGATPEGLGIITGGIASAGYMLKELAEEFMTLSDLPYLGEILPTAVTIISVAGGALLTYAAFRNLYEKRRAQ